MRYFRHSVFIHAVAVFIVLTMHFVAVPSTAQACMDCWPDPPVYYEVLSIRPSNWVTVGNYQPGDWVWIRTMYTGSGIYDTGWYVMEASDPDWWDQPHPCCSNGPWFITEQGGLYLIW